MQGKQLQMDDRPSAPRLRRAARRVTESLSYNNNNVLLDITESAPFGGFGGKAGVVPVSVEANMTGNEYKFQFVLVK
jgi:hypothetical protein